jgi:hypothetical protein
MHWPLHSWSGALQLQFPAMHSSSASQAVAQPPQLSRSEVMSMQRPLQNAWPLGQPWEQAPIWHTAPAGQARAQPPQFASSVCGSEQRPAQAVSPAPHPAAPG